MKKAILLLAGLLSLGVAAQSWASARVDALATDVREVEDIDLIWLYPNKVLDYKNTVDFRLNGSSGVFGEGVSEWGGVIADMGDDLGVWGAYVNRPAYEASKAINVFYYTGLAYDNWNPVGFASVANTLDLFWAKKASDLDLGVHLSYGAYGLTDQAFGISAGLGLTVPGFKQANFHLGYAKDFHDAGGVKDHGIYSIEAGTLWVAGISQDNDLRLFGEADVYSYKVYDPADDSTGVLLGASSNQKILGGKGTISTGLLADYWGETDGYKYNEWSLSWNGSAEAQVFDWLTLRSGIAKAIISRVYYSDNNPTYFDDSYHPVVFNLGFGINWENFVLDGVVSTGSLENSINEVRPGQGLIFSGNVFDVTEADLRYKF